jgi:hypothetical protein
MEDLLAEPLAFYSAAPAEVPLTPANLERRLERPGGERR